MKNVVCGSQHKSSQDDRFTDWLKTEERVVRFYETRKMKTILAKNHIW